MRGAARASRLDAAGGEDPGRVEQAEDELQHPGARERAVQRRPVDAGAHHPRRRRARAAARATAAAARRPSSRAATAAVRRRTRPRASPRRGARVRSRPSRTASVRLPARRSVSMSRTLLTTRIALASSPTGHGADERLPGQLLDLHEVGAGDGDDAEEEEHEQLAQPLVAVRARSAGVEHAGEDRGGADREQLPARRRRSGRCRRRRPGRRSRRSRSAPGGAARARRRSPAPARGGPRCRRRGARRSSRSRGWCRPG